MTADDWASCMDPTVMLHDLRSGRASGRKFRLWGCACVRRIWSLLTDERSRKAVEVAERYADGFVGDEELRIAAAAAPVELTHSVTAADAACGAVHPDPARAAEFAAFAARAAVVRATAATQSPRAARAVAKAAERAAQATLLRCVFGSRPFHPVVIDPSWRTPSVLTLANSIYENLRFEDMPVLADALEEAGCTDSAILDHCRGSGAHTRGCWPVDLLLDKE
ncbi:MAG TPA: hypothetical protein VEL76_04510 [Gemmataceae bacterium]|nr:hypothetical protein [Gemmataceae bacterium]